jgi:putative hydrolase of the HAD superfamily
MTYRGLILDFGGVVTTDFYGALSAFCMREGLPPEAIKNAARNDPEGHAVLAAAETGQLPQRAWEQSLGRILGLDDHGLLGRALADLRPQPEVLALVDRARAEGIRVAVLSNSWGAGDYDPYVGYDLDSRFDAVVISDQVGVRKPDPAIYLLTAEKLGMPAVECVFVDDTAANLPAAQALGMATVHFTDPAAGIAEITSLIDLT